MAQVAGFLPHSWHTWNEPSVPRVRSQLGGPGWHLGCELVDIFLSPSFTLGLLKKDNFKEKVEEGWL